jgi:hypothetical protein
MDLCIAFVLDLPHIILHPHTSFCSPLFMLCLPHVACSNFIVRHFIILADAAQLATQAGIRYRPSLVRLPHVPLLDCPCLSAPSIPVKRPAKASDQVILRLERRNLTTADDGPSSATFMVIYSP